MGNVEVTGLAEGAVEIRLNRPDRMNALTPNMWKSIQGAIEEAAADGVRAALVTGGERVFSSGSDISEILQRRWAAAYFAQAQRTVLAIRSAPFVTVAAVNGTALGGGFELALSCDLMLVNESAQLGHPEIQHGFIPGAGGTQILADRVGEQRALELILTGRRLTGVEAAQIGLALSAHPAGIVQATAMELIASICAASPTALIMAIAAMRARRPGSAGFIAERLAQSVVFAERNCES